MKFVKEKSEYGLNICLYDEGKCLSFIYSGNGDLYWSINSDNNDFSFVITKESYGVYSLFEKLFNDIENINIFEEINVPLYLETEEERQEYINDFKEKIERDKVKYRKFNFSNYRELFDKESNTITWYSDETAHEVANILKIKRLDGLFKLDFFVQPYIEGYNSDFYSSIYIPIRFRNSGSSYHPFNVIFMRMYDNMKNMDNVNDYEHQLHFDEMSNNKKIKKLIK